MMDLPEWLSRRPAGERRWRRAIDLFEKDAVHAQEELRDDWDEAGSHAEIEALAVLAHPVALALRAATVIRQAPAESVVELEMVVARLNELLMEQRDIPQPLMGAIGRLRNSAIMAAALVMTPAEVRAMELPGLEELDDADALTERELPLVETGQRVVALAAGEPHIEVSSSILYQLRQMLLPAERMAVGAVRRVENRYVVEAVMDVSEDRWEATHVNADPARMTDALVNVMNPSGAFFGFWAHSQPGNGPTATQPSQEDWENYRRRIANGDSKHLLGAIIAGDYLRFFGTKTRVEIVGNGLRFLEETKGERVYAFEN